MIDINEVAALLHVEEKLRAHGNAYQNMLAAVRAKLSQHEANHTPQPAEPEEVAVNPEPPAEEPVNGNGARRV